MTRLFRRRPAAAAGFTLIEMMVALAITMSLAVGMLTLLGNTRRTDVAQTGLEALQDDERLVLIRIIDTIQNAGYFAINTGNMTTTPTASAYLPASAAVSAVNLPAFTAGQYVQGTDGATNDVLVARYLSAAGDSTLDCRGNTNSGASPVMYNIFSVSGTSAAGYTLNCTVYNSASAGGTPAPANASTAASTVPLISGVKSFQVLYGVCIASGVSCTNGVPSANAWYTATKVTAGGLWSSVLAVQITLTMINPLKGQAGQPANLQPIVQVIPVLTQL